MPPTATASKPRSELDDAALAEELAAENGGEEGDDGLGPDGDDGSGIPGGALPHDDVAANRDDPPRDESTVEDGGDGQPPTPPADLPDDGDDDDLEAEADELFLLGDRELGLKVGGRKPDSAILKFKGGKVDLGGGQFDRGDRITTVDIWQVTGDNDQDTINTFSGEVKSTSKAQNATLCGTKRIENWLHERLREGLSEDEVARIFAALDLEVPEV